MVGAGLMGSDHVERLTNRIAGASVVAVVDVDAQRVASKAPGAIAASDLGSLVTGDRIDAVVIATPGLLHEKTLLQAIEQGKPILCEKPLTPDAAASWRIIEAEQKIGRKLIQVGFMPYIPQVEETIWREFRCQSGGRNARPARRVA